MHAHTYSFLEYQISKISLNIKTETMVMSKENVTLKRDITTEGNQVKNFKYFEAIITSFRKCVTLTIE